MEGFKLRGSSVIRPWDRKGGFGGWWGRVTKGENEDISVHPLSWAGRSNGLQWPDSGVVPEGPGLEENPDARMGSSNTIS